MKNEENIAISALKKKRRKIWKKMKCEKHKQGDKKIKTTTIITTTKTSVASKLTN